MSSNNKTIGAWTRVRAFGNSFDLELKNVKIGYLKRKSMFSSSAAGEIDGKKIIFHSVGGFNRTILISPVNSTGRIASIDLKWYGNNNGELRFSDGTIYKWKCMDFFRGKWGWVDKENRDVIVFKPKDLLNHSGSIELESGTEITFDIYLLLSLGVHLKLFFNYLVIVAVVFVIAFLRR